MKKYFLDRDGSCHWYIVDADKRKEWYEWIELYEDDERSWEAPEYAKSIGGNPSRIEFYLEEITE